MEAIIRNHHDAFNPEDEYRMSYANMLRGMPEEEQDEWGVIDLRKMIKENSPRPPEYPSHPSGKRPRRDMGLHSWPHDDPEFWGTNCNLKKDEGPAALPGPNTTLEYESIEDWKKDHPDEVLDLS